MNTKPIIIFGNGKISAVISHYIKNYFRKEIAAYTLDREYIKDYQGQSISVTPFDEIHSHYPPTEFDMFIAIGYQEMNVIRQEKVRAAIKLGYKLPSFISMDASVSSDLSYGSNCFVMPSATIQPFVKIEDNVFIWGGAMVGHHTLIKSNSWITSSSNISGGCEIGENCFLSVNSTIGNSVTVGKNCFIGANSLITKCTGDNQVFLVESTKASRLNTDQFLRMSRFSSL